MSEYSRPIYQSLCLGHFGTHHHARDLILDSDQTSVIKNTQLIIHIITERLACGPYGFENYVDMTETHLWSITNSGTWMLIMAPTYFTMIFIGQTA